MGADFGMLRGAETLLLRKCLYRLSGFSRAAAPVNQGYFRPLPRNKGAPFPHAWLRCLPVRDTLAAVRADDAV